MKFEKISTLEQLAAIRLDWNSLLNNSESNNLFLTWEWVYTWCKHLLGKGKMELVAVWESGELLAVLPFSLRFPQWNRMFPFRAMEFTGSGSVGSDYLDIVIKRGQECQLRSKLSEYLVSGRYICEFNRIKKSSGNMTDLTAALYTRGWRIDVRNVDVCPVIYLSGFDWESYLLSLSSSHRYNVRRRLKRLNKDWETTFERVESEQKRLEVFDDLVSLHERRWHEKGDDGAFNSRELVEFHNEFSQLALENNWLRMYTLKLNGNAAAAVYGFVYNHRFYYYQAGFDPQYNKFSVGLSALALTIKQALAEQVVIFDFLHGKESYKKLWTKDYEELVKIELCPPGSRGALYRKTLEIRSGLLSLYKSPDIVRNKLDDFRERLQNI